MSLPPKSTVPELLNRYVDIAVELQVALREIANSVESNASAASEVKSGFEVVKEHLKTLSDAIGDFNAQLTAHTVAITASNALLAARTELYTTLTKGFLAAADKRWPWAVLGIAVGMGILQIDDLVRLLFPTAANAVLPSGGTP